MGTIVLYPTRVMCSWVFGCQNRPKKTQCVTVVVDVDDRFCGGNFGRCGMNDEDNSVRDCVTCTSGTVTFFVWGT